MRTALTHAIAHARRLYHHCLQTETAFAAGMATSLSVLIQQLEIIESKLPPKPCAECVGNGSILVPDEGPVLHGDEWGAVHEITCPKCKGTGVENEENDP